MQLIIDNDTIIEEPIENIVYELKREADWDVFSIINKKDKYIQASCPFHADGHESHPSFSIYTDYNSESIMPGSYNCFTCGSKGSIIKLVSKVLGLTWDEAIQWLKVRYGKFYDCEEFSLPSWDINQIKHPTYLDESILTQYAYYHPYLETRHIDFETAKKFQIGYNKDKNTITFPVWSEDNKLLMITERSIDSKKFYIPEGAEKPIYLLNYVLNEHKKYVVICESQFNALTCWTYGIPAVALFGTGNDTQYSILNHCGINSFILCFDGDEAGRKGAQKFKKNIRKDAFVTDIIMPNGMDVNDMRKEDFLNLLKDSYAPLDKFNKRW